MDSVVHAVAILAGLVGAVVLIMMAAQEDPIDLVVATIYSGGLLAMFGCSLAYNLGRWSRHGDLLRALDHSAILVMIAGTYTPLTVLRLEGTWSFTLTLVVWSAAGLGISLRLFASPVFEKISLAFYLFLGWISLLAVVPLARSVGFGTLTLVAAGGLLYTVGVAFHLCERLPFQNAIWHAFVLAGAGVHFAAVARAMTAS